jgi:Uma2 family endonuclease
VVEAFLKARGRGVTCYAPCKVRVRAGAFREPDVCVLLNDKDLRRGRKYWSGADMVIEVVSPGGEARDYLEKRDDYSGAKIPKYWIVDPWKKQLLVLRLTNGGYADHATLPPGDVAESAALPGFRIDVGRCFQAADRAAANDQPLEGADQ